MPNPSSGGKRPSAPQWEDTKAAKKKADDMSTSILNKFGFNTPGKTRVSSMGTDARIAQAKAAKAARDKKILDQMEKDHKGPNRTWNNGYTN
jgi:hypothetical protein